jgi:hypothetical protein
MYFSTNGLAGGGTYNCAFTIRELDIHAFKIKPNSV